MTELRYSESGPVEGGTWAHVYRHARGSWGWLILAAAAELVASLSQLALPFLVGKAIDAILAGGLKSSTLVGCVSAALLVVAMPPLATTAGAMFRGKTAQRLRTEVTAHSFRLGVPGRRAFTNGDVVTRAMIDVDAVATTPLSVWRAANTTFVAVGSIVIVFGLDWRLGLAVTSTIPIVAVVGAIVGRVIFKGQRQSSAHEAVFVDRFLEAILGRRTISALGTFDQEVERVTEPLPSIAHEERRMLEATGAATSAASLTRFALLIVVTGIGAWGIAADRVTAGGLLAAVRYAQQAFESIVGVLDGGWFQVVRQYAQGSRVRDLLGQPNHLRRATGCLAASAFGGLRFADVTVFAPNSDTALLDNLNLHVPAGTTMSIVGRSGEGKSTLAMVAGRLIECDAGEVYLGDVRIVDLSVATVRERVAYAFEQPALLGDTVAANISLGVIAPAMSVSQAALAAHADEFIERLPLSYDQPMDTLVLSGGERQRLGLARAAIRNAEVIVLDDATSHLDVATEAAIYDAFRTLSANKTTLVVTHRAATAARSDIVAWLDNGGIRAVGHHEELWRDADYRALFEHVETPG